MLTLHFFVSYHRGVSLNRRCSADGTDTWPTFLRQPVGPSHGGSHHDKRPWVLWKDSAESDQVWFQFSGLGPGRLIRGWHKRWPPWPLSDYNCSSRCPLYLHYFLSIYPRLPENYCVENLWAPFDDLVDLDVRLGMLNNRRLDTSCPKILPRVLRTREHICGIYQRRGTLTHPG